MQTELEPQYMQQAQQEDRDAVQNIQNPKGEKPKKKKSWKQPTIDTTFSGLMVKLRSQARLSLSDVTHISDEMTAESGVDLHIAQSAVSHAEGGGYTHSDKVRWVLARIYAKAIYPNDPNIELRAAQLLFQMSLAAANVEINTIISNPQPPAQYLREYGGVQSPMVAAMVGHAVEALIDVAHTIEQSGLGGGQPADLRGVLTTMGIVGGDADTVLRMISLLASIPVE